MKKLVEMLVALILLMVMACDKPTLQESDDLLQSNQQASLNAAEGAMTMDVYFDGELYTVNMFELSEKAAESIIEHNKSLNEIYTTSDLDEMGEFLPIIDAVPGEDYNPLWREVEIEWSVGVVPYQLTSEEEIDAAVQAGEITLEDTDEVYRCAVIGKKN